LFPPASFIYNKTKIPINDIKKVLNETQTYLEFKKKPNQKRFRMITAEYPDNVWQADLIDFSIARTPYYRLPNGDIAINEDGSFVYEPTKKQIKNFKLEKDLIRNYNELVYKNQTLQYNYILVVIDVFSRYVWTYNLHTKTTEEIQTGFEHIFKTNQLKFKKEGILVNKKDEKNLGCPVILQTDLEKGIVSEEFQEYLKEKEIKWWGVTGKQGAAICERVIQTLKKAIWKVFEIRNKYQWYDSIDNIVKAYNQREHSTIKTTPEKARKEENYNDVKLLVSKHSEKYRNNRTELPRYKIGDRVRVKIEKSRFEKGYTKTFTNKIYVIDSVVYDGCYYYTLEGVYNKLDRKRMFYAEELLLS
jgi:transposase InsO family protein